MKFDPKEANKLIPDGEYDAQVTSAEETKSKAGNDMMKLTVKVWAMGETHHVFDYAVVPSGLWKIRQICEATGQMDRFNAGAIEPRDLENKTLRVFIKTAPDKTGAYPDKNVIAKYVTGSHGAPSSTTPPDDSEIPF